MSKTDDLLKRAEKVIYAHKDGYYGCSAREERYSKLIQELSDKLKAYTERMESKKLLEKIADNDDFTNAVIDAGNVFPHISPKDMETIAQAAINVIKGDDDDR